MVWFWLLSDKSINFLFRWCVRMSHPPSANFLLSLYTTPLAQREFIVRHCLPCSSLCAPAEGRRAHTCPISELNASSPSINSYCPLESNWWIKHTFKYITTPYKIYSNIKTTMIEAIQFLYMYLKTHKRSNSVVENVLQTTPGSGNRSRCCPSTRPTCSWIGHVEFGHAQVHRDCWQMGGGLLIFIQSCGCHYQSILFYS